MDKQLQDVSVLFLINCYENMIYKKGVPTYLFCDQFKY